MLGFLAGLPGKLKTLTDRLTATRAGLLDNLDATVSTRAAASTALSSATWTGTKAGYLDAAVSSRLGSIKSIQRGALTISSGATSGTQTITAVDVNKSILYSLGGGGSYNSPMRVELTNSTTITIYSNGLDGNAHVAGWQIVEFN